MEKILNKIKGWFKMEDASHKKPNNYTVGIGINSILKETYNSNIFLDAYDRERKQREEYNKAVEEELKKFEPLTREILEIFKLEPSMYAYYPVFPQNPNEDRNVIKGKAVDELVKKYLFKQKLEDVIND